MNIDRLIRVQRRAEEDLVRWERVLGLQPRADTRAVVRAGVPRFGMSEDIGIAPPSVFDTESPSMPGGRAEPMPLPPGLDFTGLGV